MEKHWSKDGSSARCVIVIIRTKSMYMDLIQSEQSSSSFDKRAMASFGKVDKQNANH